MAGCSPSSFFVYGRRYRNIELHKQDILATADKTPTSCVFIVFLMFSNFFAEQVTAVRSCCSVICSFRSN